VKFQLYIRLFFESVAFAINALVSNKLRTTLSLLGVTIGIFSIISVFTMVDSLEKEVRSSVESLGENVVFVQKWPWGFDGDYEWWKYLNRPHPNYKEFQWIQKDVKSADAVALMYGFGRDIIYKGTKSAGVTVMAASRDFDKVRKFDIYDGRYFSLQENSNGAPVCIMGALVSLDLFGPINPVGKRVKISGYTVEVIGMFTPEGSSLMGESLDEQVVIPMNFGRKLVDLKKGSGNPSIMVKAKEDVSAAQLKDELKVLLRSVRRLKPKAPDNFAINEISLLSKAFDSLFGMINTIGFIIGLFSILVGGFSIANIMFVSVKERTNIIGIQKSLGAKNSFILFQFLTESVILCLIGGGVGLLIIFLGVLGINQAIDMEVTISLKNISLGLFISVAIGLISGSLPAISASRMNPVDAIRSKG
jgi:putative ABC transport system permease protein